MIQSIVRRCPWALTKKTQQSQNRPSEKLFFVARAGGTHEENTAVTESVKWESADHFNRLKKSESREIILVEKNLWTFALSAIHEKGVSHVKTPK